MQIESFSDIFTDISYTDDIQTRHNDYNFVNKPVIKSYLERFPYKQILSNWNSLSIDLRSSADEDPFKQILKEMYLSNYDCDTSQSFSISVFCESIKIKVNFVKLD
jgi:hypothetical protein